MKYYGKDLNSEEEWDKMALGYSGALIDEYHDHRLKVINALIPEVLYQEGGKIFDFGCGDAVLFEQFLRKGVNICGVDISAEMITLAKQRLSQIGANPDLAQVGGVAELSRLEASSMDAIMSFNVLAYLTDEEEQKFYENAYRVLRPGGYLIVTHSNELFDMFSLNDYTVDFFKRHFVSDISLQPALRKLILNASTHEEDVVTYNVRENPITYNKKLARYGFIEQRQEYIRLHAAPPPLLSEKRHYPDTLSWAEEDRWKLMFICSSFGVLARRHA